jgi:hypothetical protein
MFCTSLLVGTESNTFSEFSILSMVENAVTASWTLEKCTEKCQNTIDRFFAGTWPVGTFLVPDVAVVLQLHMPFSIKLAHSRFYGMELGHTKCSESPFYCCINSRT